MKRNQYQHLTHGLRVTATNSAGANVGYARIIRAPFNPMGAYRGPAHPIMVDVADERYRSSHRCFAGDVREAK